MYLKVIIETLLFTAQQNIAQRSSAENRADIKRISDENRGNFIELLHIRSKDIPCLSSQLQ